MGNGKSRFQQRKETIDDLNTVGINYLGGHGYDEALLKNCRPIDKVVEMFCNQRKKETSALFQIHTVECKAINQQNMKEVYLEIIKSLELKRFKLHKKFRSVGDKYACITG